MLNHTHTQPENSESYSPVFDQAPLSSCPACRSKLPVAKTIERVVCLNCRQSTKLSRPWTKFCSEKCRHEYHDAFRNPRLNQLHTTSEMAGILGVSVSTIRNRVKRGDLQSHKVGNILLILESDPKGMPEVVPAEIVKAFNEFAHRYSLSVRQFAKVCGLMPTTAHRLLSGSLLAHRFKARQMTLIRGLRSFLIGHNKTEAEAISEIELIFKDLKSQ